MSVIAKPHVTYATFGHTPNSENLALKAFKGGKFELGDLISKSV